MSATAPTLHLICGKIASGKSTLARQLAEGETTILIAEDDWLSALFADQMNSPADYVRCAGKLRSILGPHVIDLLKSGVSVVLGFPANTVETRQWMRGLIEASGAAHQMHLITTPDETCLARLRARNARGDHPFAVTEAQFHIFSKHHAPPTAEESFTLVIHDRPG
ncbi:MAG: ATP-binding protein [Silicimonas sp.]|nr:ATP-binding protein [Silicimonas sp.]